VWPIAEVVPREVTSNLTKIRRGGYVFITWAGDHGPRHVHVHRGGRLLAKWDLESSTAIGMHIVPARVREIIAELVKVNRSVLATGGGAVLREGNRRALFDSTIVVYLRSSPEELFRRLRHDKHRPLLQVADPLRKLREIYVQRDPLYRRTAHFIIETGRPSVQTLVNMILMQLELAGLVDPARVPSTVEPRPEQR